MTYLRIWCSACDNGGHGGCRRMEKNVAHGGWTISLLTVAAQHGGLRWLGGCGRHNGMEEQKNRVGAGHWMHITIIVFRISLRVYSSFTIK